jgi:REP element-mobilizing transposase RayT
MGRPQRIQFPGAFLHVFNRGVNKQIIVQDEQDRRTFMSLLAETVKKFNLLLFAYCLMDNHFHLFLQISERNLDKALRHLLSNYSRYVNNRYDRVGHLFQGRYQSRVVDTDAYGLALIRYIHHNPLEAGLVSKIEDYPWSSYACYVGKLPQWDWLNIDWILSQLHSDKMTALKIFEEFHAHVIPKEEKETFSNPKKDIGTNTKSARH